MSSMLAPVDRANLVKKCPEVRSEDLGATNPCTG